MDSRKRIFGDGESGGVIGGGVMDIKKEPELALIKMLIDDNNRLRNAGCKLAEAALVVATEYDGVHRLMLATSEWAKAVADEGGRSNNK